jgi:hypothetical protein
MNFEELITLQLLKRKAQMAGKHPGSKLVEYALETADSPEIRQLCAKITTTLYSRVEEVCDVVGLTKRQFVEWAVADAVDRVGPMVAKYFGDDGPDISPASGQVLIEEDE